MRHLAPLPSCRGRSPTKLIGSAPKLRSLRLSPRSCIAWPAAVAALLCGHAAVSQVAPAEDVDTGIVLRPADRLQALPRGAAASALPVTLSAREIRGRPDLETEAEGDAVFRRGGLLISADRLTYDHSQDLARATGGVRISRDGNVYTGPELELKVQRFEGFFLNPTYRFARTNAGGTAARVDFLDADRSIAIAATYSSCPTDGSGGPAWLLTTDRVKLDFETNEGVAEGAVLRFLGVPILAAPSLSFPLSDERKSGWLPPNMNLDNRSGFQLAVPYYWNIAPNRDATLTPLLSSRRGLGIDTEYRYIEPRYGGSANLNLLPNDRVTGRSRYALDVIHEGRLASEWELQLRSLRVSDDSYWKDFPRGLRSLASRLLATDLLARRTQPLGAGEGTVYARVQRWQVLQDPDPASRIDAPYERLPQLGARVAQRVGAGFDVAFEGEANRFGLPPGVADPTRATGVRLHAIGSMARPYVSPGWSLTPRLSFNAASYALDQPLSDGRKSAARIIPTLSVDSSWVFERDAQWFGRAMRQTLEPRLLYVNTPFHDQIRLPNFDAAAKDFNFESIYTDNAFSGVDRVSDANQVTAGVTTRVLDPQTGAEALRLGIVQRFLFSDQRLTPECTAQLCTPLTQRFSDVLLLGSTRLLRDWTLDSSVQYNAATRRTTRSIIGARFAPGPFRTVNAAYRYTRDQSEQVELGWQWPLSGSTPAEGDRSRSAAGSGGGGSCQGSWYSVGRFNYSTRDSRVTDSVLGFEYDAGCWIGRIVSERLSTGRSEATTRLLLQLELVGLSRLGSNPLQVLKDNIPGYKLLRDDRAVPAPLTPYD